MNKYESTNLHRAVIIAALLGALLAFLPAATASETACVEHLRCEYRTAPLGIDIAEPRLSWVVRADQRGWRQTAYQVLVASSREKLNQDVGDLWDSGRTVSDQSIHVAYDGRPLKSSMRCWWKVRVWDHRGQLSQWSKPATWTMGLFEESAWDSAQWIGAREEATMAKVTCGWRTPQTDQSAARPWVQIDLGRAAPIEQVRLWNPYDFDKDRFSNRPYITMCEHVRVDASNTPDMSDSTTLPFIGESHQRIRQSNYRFDGRGVNARYVRVTVERLPRHADGMWFGLRELEVTSERVNIALGCPATASESVEQDGWSTAYLTDGQQSTDNPSVMLRKSLELTAEPVRATATISGLGYSELYINGDKIGDRVLDPGWCDFTRRVPYTTYDVTRHFKTGENVLGIQLGNGFFNPQVADVWALERAAWVAAPRCRLHVSLDYADGSSRTITSDESWKWSTGELVFNCVRGGETIDKRKAQPQWNKTGFDDESWNPATRLKAPSGRMVAQMHRPVRVMAKPKPQNIREVRPGVWVFDFGQNITGWTRLKTSGPAGHRIVMLFGETVDDDGSVNTLHCTQFIQGRYQKGELILSGNGEEVYEPRFSYFGFRYVQVEGLLEAPDDDTLEGRWVHSDMPETGHFLCSDDRLNCLQEVIVRSNKNYTHHFPRDPAREKLGWTQDAQTCMAMGLMNMEMANIYRNWYTHILDQQQPNGHVRPIGPSSGWGQSYGADATPGICSDPWWGGMVTLMPWIWYEHTGDQRLIEAGYDAMKGWVDYVQGTSTDDMVSWFLGDWCEVSDHHGLARRTPVEQTATAGFYMAVENTRRAAELLGRDEDAKHYAELAGRIRTKFNRKFLDSNTGLYAADSQTSQALPLDLGLSPTATRPLVLERLVEDIHARDDHLSTGFVGTLPLLRALTDNGRADLAHTIVTREDWPGWLHMLNQGSTTIWEDWSGPKHPGDNVSRNIVSLGGPVGWWFYYGLAGIRPDPAGPGFKKILIKPEVVGDLKWVKAHHDSMYGRIAVHWQRDADRLTLAVTIPANTSATIHVPTSDAAAVTESDRPALESPGVTFLRTENGSAVFAVGSGSYRFAAPLNALSSNTDGLHAGFQDPPADCRPEVFYQWMGGMISREGISKDLEAMSAQGIGGVLILQASDQLVFETQWSYRDYPGKVACLSDEWFSMMNWVARETDRLGMTMSVFPSPGWNYFSGKSITPELSLKVMVTSRIEVEGPRHFDEVISRDYKVNMKSNVWWSVGEKPVIPDWSSEKEDWKKLKESFGDYYRDVAVVAFPTKEKIPTGEVIDLTDKMDAGGRLVWDVPKGNWTVMRFGCASGKDLNHPAPIESVGLEVDRMDPAAVRMAFDEMTGRIVREARARGYKSFKGFDTDSYESGFQDFNTNYVEAFKKRRGYDPVPWLATWDNSKKHQFIVENKNMTERFQRDMYKTINELQLDGFYGELRRISDELDLTWMIEPYFKHSLDWRTIGSRADWPGSEFWTIKTKSGGIISHLIGAAPDIAELYGREIVWAEAFTAGPVASAWRNTPRVMKPYGDSAYTNGINHFIMHGFVHSPWSDEIRPGLSFGLWGTQMGRNVTWWPYASAWTRYMARCAFMLRKGEPVVDVLAYPQRRRSIPVPELEAGNYKQTVLNDEALMKLISVEEGWLKSQGGVSYRALALVPEQAVTPEALKKIHSLVKKGGTLIGNPPPPHSASMENYPGCDKEIEGLIRKLWGEFKQETAGTRTVGKGKVIWGKTIIERLDQLTGGADFQCRQANKEIQRVPDVKFIHRKYEETDIYFISNLEDSALELEASFRVAGRQPELWDAVTGELRDLPQFRFEKGRTLLPIRLESFQSAFVIFRKKTGLLKDSDKANFTPHEIIKTLSGSWDVSFDPEWGGPGTVTFDDLQDWSEHSDSGIKYYSGTAVYRKTFDLPKGVSEGKSLWLDLGTVRDLARVSLNGQDLGTIWCAPWGVDISEAIQTKENELIIEVVNTWINRFIGDEQEPADIEWVELSDFVNGQGNPRYTGYRQGVFGRGLKDLPDWLIEGKPRPSKGRYTFANWQYYTPDAPLHASGLMGPVTVCDRFIPFSVKANF